MRSDRFASRRGFTLLELMVALVIVGILLVIAYPDFAAMLDGESCRETARNFVASLRNARSRAVGKNIEHRVEFDLDVGAYRLTHGNRPTNSTASSWNNNVVFDWIELPAGQALRANVGCDVETGIVDIHLNPNGSGESQYICLLDREQSRRFRVGIPHSATGQVVLSRWNGATWE